MQARTGAWVGVALAILVLVAVAAFVLLGGHAPTAGPSSEPSVPGASADVTPSPTLDPELLHERLTVLLIGLDSSAARDEAGMGVNSDTLMLASISADHSEVTLVSLPRDTVDIPLPGGGTWERKVNAIYAVAGVETLVAAMEELFGVPIDGYAQIDMDGLPELVDALGGVSVDPDEPLVDPIVDLRMQAGPQTVDGETALAYVRTRVDTDYGRAARQQEVLLELLSTLVAPETDVDVRALLDGLSSFETDLPLGDLPTLLEVGRRARDADVLRQVLRPPEFISFEGDAGDGRGYVLIPDVDAIRDFARRTIGE